MYSFIISSKNTEAGLKKAKTISSENKVDELDITIESFEKSVGIVEIREIQKKLFLKPARGKYKSLIIDASNGITTESQNALLKILEEPPPSTFIFLVVADINILLPTILSRCKVIKINEESLEITKDDIENFQKIILRLQSKDAGSSLKLAQDFGETREDAIIFLEKTINVGREIIIKQINSDINPAGLSLKYLTELIKKLEKSRYTVKNTNVNPRFILENTLLSIA